MHRYVVSKNKCAFKGLSVAFAEAFVGTGSQIWQD